MTKRTHVVLPAAVIAGIDKLVGKRGRSAFISELAQRELKIRRQREAIEEAASAWKSQDHPELANGASAWVRQIRDLDSKRFQEIQSRRRQK